MNNKQQWRSLARSHVRSLARRLLRNHPRLKALILRLLTTVRYLLASVAYWLRRGLSMLRADPAVGAARRRARAQMLAAKGDWAAAAKLWQRIIEKDKKDGKDLMFQADMALVWTEYGRCLLHLGQLGQARLTLGQALISQPDFTLAHRLLGWTASEQRDWPAMAGHWRAALAGGLNEPEAAEARRALIHALINMGAFEKAEPLLQELAAGDDAAQCSALELRATMATLRLDDEGARAAWQELGQRFPKIARKIPAWLGFMGNEKLRAGSAGDGDSEKAEHSTDDLRRARDAAAARRALAYLGHLPKGEHIALMRETVARFPPQSSAAAAELHGRYLGILADNLMNPAELAELQAQAAVYGGELRDHPKAWLLLAQAAVSAEDEAAVGKLLASVGKQLGAHTELERLRLWLAARRGEHAQAQAIAAELRHRVYVLAEDGRGLDLRPLNKVPVESEWRRKQDRILLFTCFRNERTFAGWFLDYYRRLGVEHFFIVDNVSTDGTAEFLAGQKDVSVFASKDNFRRTVSGMQWMNELIRRYGEDNWCVYVDADEELVLPLDSRLHGNDGSGGDDEMHRRNGSNADGSLRRFVDGMAARGEEVLPGYMLDTYPADMAALKDFRPGTAPLSLSNLIDPDYFFFGGLLCCFMRTRGGVRERLFHIRDRIEKAPILRGGGGRLYRDNHHINYARPSRQCAALLHHKLLREAIEVQHGESSTWRIESRLRQRQRLHDQYRQSGYLDPTGGIPRGPETITYQSPTQLQTLGLLGDITALRRGP